ncbi:hypothetical protein ABK040_010168 [Willaertia magna]
MIIEDNAIHFKLLIETLYNSDTVEINFETIDDWMSFILLADKYQFLKERDESCNVLLQLINSNNCTITWLFSNSIDFLSNIKKGSINYFRDMCDRLRWNDNEARKEFIERISFLNSEELHDLLFEIYGFYIPWEVKEVIDQTKLQ